MSSPISEKLKVALLQCPLEWENPAANRLRFDQWFRSIEARQDLIVIPEMFSTGFTMNAAGTAETMKGDTVKWLCEHSADKDAVICGSLIIKERGKFYNRFIWAERGKIKWAYDKRHLFALAGENEIFTKGRKLSSAIDFGPWKVMPRICYDLRFPVWNRNTQSHIQIYVANWPAARIAAWDTLLKARAIENQCYVIGVNRVGIDGNGHAYPGHSAVYSALGESITPGANIDPEWIYAELELSHVAQLRAKLPFALEADEFRVKL